MPPRYRVILCYLFFAWFSSLIGRDIVDWNRGWVFHLGCLDTNKVFEVGLNEPGARVLNLPHDWSIEGPYNEDAPAGAEGAFLPTGVGWYEKSFEYQKDWQGKCVFVEFDGVYMNSEVWLNGKYLGVRPYGYISFGYELTTHLKQGMNRLHVRVDNSNAPSGRWYTGSGIYRNVRLVIKNPVHIAKWGTFVRSTNTIKDDQAELLIDVEVTNLGNDVRSISLEIHIYDASSLLVTTLEQPISLKPGTDTITQKATIENPKLWSPENPYLYSVEFEIIHNNEVVDFVRQKTGIRSLEFTTDRGFLLNGASTLIKGVCNHHDAGAVGAAVPLDILRYRLQLLKDMGCNAIRTAHNPQSPEFYQLCDEMGFLIMNEAFDGWFEPKAEHDYGQYFAEWWEQDLEDFIKRDRNHPSVFIWSIGNEVRGYTDEQQEIMVNFVKNLDNTRPITQGRGYRGKFIDLAGFNGHGEMKGSLEKFHEKDKRPIIGTEITHTLQTRGVYKTQTWIRRRDAPAPWEVGKTYEELEPYVTLIPNLSEEEVFPEVNPRYQSSYDNAIVRIGIRDDWKRVEEYSWYLGNFRWTGFDYLGESFSWPARTENFGIIDLAGFPKDHYYLYQSLWSDKPMVHLLPHWTHPGKEEAPIPVVVYTNGQAAELHLNGNSLGKKPMTDEMQIVWQVPYEPGILEAVAFFEDGNKVRKSFITSKKADRLEIKSNRDRLSANGRDVARVEVIVTDDKGVMVPHANCRVSFEIEGPAKLLAVENGDILDIDPHQELSRKIFNGKCLLLIQSTTDSGKITIKANAIGLVSNSIQLESF